MVWRMRRRARKTHYCGCGNRIGPGDLHWEFVAVDEDFTDGWWRLRECSYCAQRYGRPLEEAA